MLASVPVCVNVSQNHATPGYPCGLRAQALQTFLLNIWPNHVFFPDASSTSDWIVHVQYMTMHLFVILLSTHAS